MPDQYPVPGLPLGKGNDEFYLASSEKDMMRRISDILRRQGYVAVADLDGKTCFFLEPQGNPYKTVRTMQEIRDIRTLSPTYGRSFDELVQQAELLDEMLEDYGFDHLLTGTKLVRSGIEILNRDYSLIRPISKGLYRVLADRNNSTVKQVERNIRYAISRSRFNESNSVVLNRLLQEYQRKIQELAT